MPRHLSLALVSLCLVATAVAAPVASAKPGDKATAAAVRKSTIGLRFYVVAQTPAIQASLKQLDDPVCTRAIERMPDEQAPDLLFSFVLPVAFEMLVVPLQNGMNQFVAELDQVPMRDPVLRSGRAGWRVVARDFGAFAPPPTNICAQLDAWRQAGYPAASRPSVDDPALGALLDDDSGLDGASKKIARAGRRLRELGVSKRVVGWWTFDTLLDGVDVDEGSGSGSAAAARAFKLLH
jgi:hypothetical protein